MPLNAEHGLVAHHGLLGGRLQPYTRPEIRFVRGGTLDDPTGVAPDVHIFTRSKVGWVTLSDPVPAFDIYYDTRKLWPAASLERLEAILAASASDA